MEHISTYIVVAGEDLKTQFQKIAGDKMPRLRVLIVTSPPWGVYDETHDQALDSTQMKVKTLTHSRHV